MEDAIHFSDRVLALSEQAQREVAGQFSRVDAIAEYNTRKVLAAFQKNRVSESFFAGTTGYGYDDIGRDALDHVYADIFHTEDALVRIQFVNGTHAIAAALYAALRPGDTLVSAIASPYDTLLGVIGVVGDEPGSLKQYGVRYHEVALTPENQPDKEGLAKAVREPGVKAVLIQRSKGYSTRSTQSVEQVGELIAIVRENNPDAICIVDNCYGEFTETIEPTQVGADLIAGSLIKNPGGGLAPTGGYVAGRSDLVKAAAMRLTVPGIGGECGSTLGNNRLLYQGLFMAPHTVAQAVKTAIFGARLMELMGYETEPTSRDVRHDIIQMISLKTPETLVKFCKGLQSGSPIDSYVTPVPVDTPGYDSQVIMAAGGFIQGASIELSADAPMRPPYTIYMQGGLTYESGKIGVMMAAEELLK